MSNLLETNLLNDSQKEELRLYIDASEAYYGGEVLMPDDAFDELEKKLLSYDIGELNELIEKNIFRIENGLSNVELLVSEEETKHMLISIKKYKYEGFSKLKSKLFEYFGDKVIELLYSPKLDGGALKIEWDLESKKIIMIQSRGGLDVTNTFKNMPSIQKTIEFNKPIVAGELLIKKKVFEQNYSDEYENPRNFIGSLMKKLSVELSVIKNLDFIPCTDGTNPLFGSIIGWTTLTDEKLFNIEKIYSILKSAEFPYLVDGIVIGFSENGERRIKDNYPLNLLAIKFPSERVRTKVIGFEWTQKKSGKLTPKLKLEPVRLDGITVSNASIYNYRYLKESGVGIGSIVEITKSNDIIPVFVKAITKTHEIIYPTCQYIKKGINLCAIDLSESRMFKFSSALKSLNIDGVGDVSFSEIGKIVDYNIIDLFNPAFKPAICAILKGGDKWNKFQDFYNIKSMYLDTLIFILQFDNVGPVTANKLALLIAGKSNDVSNISSEILQNVPRGEGFKLIVNSIQKLKSFGINVVNPIEKSDDLITFEMTGNPPQMTKQEFVKKIKNLFPNSAHESLKKDTKYLFCDNIGSNSGKINKARKYGVKIVTYLEALKGNI